jgi:DNA-3-methyladenine glycosylase
VAAVTPVHSVCANVWFMRPTTVVAADLIGCLLCRRMPDGSVIRARISETEAYIGHADPACHAHLGRRTTRTEAMFAEGGILYVYLTYGIHYMLNVVSFVAGEPEAVLIRAAFVEGTDLRALAGPAKLTKALQIDKALYGHSMTPETGLWIEDDGCRPPVSVRPRIGIESAGEAQHWLLRYVWTGHGSLSKR